MKFKELFEANEKSLSQIEIFKQKLEEKERELLAFLDQIREDVESGEFEVARIAARKFEDMCHQTNVLASRLADMK